MHSNNINYISFEYDKRNLIFVMLLLSKLYNYNGYK